MSAARRIQVLELTPELRRQFRLVGSPARFGVFRCLFDEPYALIRAAIEKSAAEGIARMEAEPERGIW